VVGVGVGVCVEAHVAQSNPVGVGLNCQRLNCRCPGRQVGMVDRMRSWFGGDSRQRSVRYRGRTDRLSWLRCTVEPACSCGPGGAQPRQVQLRDVQLGTVVLGNGALLDGATTSGLAALRVGRPRRHRVRRGPHRRR